MRRSPGWLGNVPVAVVAGVVLVVAFALRWYGVDWDGGAHVHPDERLLLETTAGLRFDWPLDPAVLLRPDSPASPQFFAYGSFPFYLLKLTAHLAALLRPELAGPDIRLVGRTLTALADTATVLLTFLIGRRIGGARLGLLAAALLAVAVLPIQYAHFYTVDPIATLLVTAALLLSLVRLDRPSIGLSVALGAVVGLAFATKLSVAPLLLPVGLAHLLPALRATDRRKAFVGALAGLGAMTATMLLTFLFVEPYAAIDFGRFVADNAEQGQMVRRQIDYPFTRQYEGTPAYLYQIVQYGLFGLGPFGVVAWLGLGYGLARAVRLRRMRDRREWILLAWALPYFAITGAFEVKFLRYLLPLTPVLAIFGAQLLLDGMGVLGRQGPAWRLAGRIAVACLVGATAAYAIGYVAMYRAPHPANAMTAWLAANVPPGSTILMEHWEERLPGLDAYRVVPLRLYDEDDEHKLNWLAAWTAAGDYAVYFSHRLYGTIPRLPDRYPMTGRFYRLLFGGALGYRLERAEGRYPTWFGLPLVHDQTRYAGLPTPRGFEESLPSPRLDLGYVDESYSVYDHATVLLFKRERPLDPAEVRALLRPDLVQALP